MGNQVVELAWNEESGRNTLAFGQLDEPRDVPVRQRHHGGTEHDGRREPDEESRAVKQRHGRGHHIGFAEAEIHGCGIGGGRPRPVGYQYRLGKSGGAAGEGDPEGVGVANVDVRGRVGHGPDEIVHPPRML